MNGKRQDETPPHRVRYDSPKENRQNKTFYIAQKDREQLRERVGLAEREFDEKVYNLDVYLASVRAGIHCDDEAFLDEMRAIGYGYFE